MKIAIAGGIGSGKSLVTKCLRSLGAKVVVADEVNAELLKDPAYVDLIENTFPSAVHNKVIDKKELADLVYHDEEKRRILMDLAHPRIFDRMFSMFPKESIVFYEIPLLSEAHFSFDQVWFVYSDPEVRAARVSLRDGVTMEYAHRIISLQSGEAELRSAADVVIVNDGDTDALCEMVKTQYYFILRYFSY